MSYPYDDYDPYEIRAKHEALASDLKNQRSKFAGIGTNKAKRRLNKLAINDPIAKAIRLALEVEDKNISAKQYYGKYRERNYDQKAILIDDLCKLFKEQNWIYGIQNSDVYPVTHVIYFEIPTCEQISWHFSPTKESDFPIYAGEWDGKQNSTLGKLETIAIKLLPK